MIKFGRNINRSLDAHYNEIKELLDKKVSVSSIAKIIGKSYPTVYSYVKRRNLKMKEEKTNKGIPNIAS